MTKRVTILGSTGSIGTQTLQVISHLEPDFRVVALSANNNIDLLEKQVRQYNPEVVAIFDEENAREFARRVPEVTVVAGMEGLCEVATLGDVVVTAIVGAAAILPTLSALRAGRRVALANKEVLVMAGQLVMEAACESGAEIIPIDSEQSALFQCLEGRRNVDVDRLILTASGGPFHGYTQEQLEMVTLEDALKHPNWEMGAKVTVDSSTLMNKGLEVIEAHWLFNHPLDRIDVVVHPQSLVHSFVEFIDGSLLAQVAEPEMVLPIQFALTYPERAKRMVPRFDFKRFSKMEFYDPDVDTFVCLSLAFEAAKRGGSLPCYMNAANEVLVERFVCGEIGWQAIGHKLEELMANHKVVESPALEELLDVDDEARLRAQEV